MEKCTLFVILALAFVLSVSVCWAEGTQESCWVQTVNGWVWNCPHGSQDEGATGNKDGFCQIYPADSGLPLTLVTTMRTIEVEAHSSNVNFVCHFTYDPKILRDPPKKALHHKGFFCETGFGVTYDTQAVTTPGGQVLLKCKIRANEVTE